MNTAQIQEGIRDINLTYLMFAQQMINDDKPAAVFRLGISLDLADIISSLTPPQLIKMAASNALLCRFRFDENIFLNMLSDHSQARLMAQEHTTILMSDQSVEEIA